MNLKLSITFKSYECGIVSLSLFWLHAAVVIFFHCILPRGVCPQGFFNRNISSEDDMGCHVQYYL